MIVFMFISALLGVVAIEQAVIIRRKNSVIKFWKTIAEGLEERIDDFYAHAAIEKELKE